MHESEQIELMRRVAHIFVTVNKLTPEIAEWHVTNMTVSELLFTEKVNGQYLENKR